MSILKDLTIVFNSYYSEKQLIRVLRKLKNYKVIIVENSQNWKIKKTLERKYKNLKIFIPSKNLGLANGFNLAIKKAKSKYIFLNNPDLKISNNSIIRLYKLARRIKNFGIIAPIYKNEKTYKNYSDYEIKLNKSLSNVSWIDNNFLVKRNLIKNYLFDKNFFLYFETIDLCKKLTRAGQKLYVAKNIKFDHFGSKSVDPKYDKIVLLTRAWHYNWSKFFYFKKNYNYFYAIFKIMPNLFQASTNFLLSLIKLNFFKTKTHLIEIYGILSAIIFLKSFYRAKN